MIKYKALLYNILNMMVKCPNCKRNMGEAYTKDDGLWHRIEKACYKCSTVIWVTFHGDQLHETMYITDGLKLSIKHAENKTIFYKREIKFLTIQKSHVSIDWIPIHEMPEILELDFDHLNDMKLKMETLLTFS